MTQRKVSPHTIASYRDTFRLLLQFAQKRLSKAPSQLGLNDLDSVNGSRKLKGSLLTGLDQAYRLRKLYLFFSICSPTLPVPGLLAGLPLTRLIS
jgi:site-specific recombinase XerC